VEDYLLPQLGTFSLSEIEAAAKLAAERMGLVAHPIVDLSLDNIEAIGQLVRQAERAAVTKVSPAEIVAKVARMGPRRTSLVQNLEVFSQLISAFRPSSTPNIATVCDIASIVNFAHTIPSELDPYLWFDRLELEPALLEGAKRLFDLSGSEIAL